MGIIILVSLLLNVSALTLTSGDSIIKDYSNEFYSLNGSYSILGNSSNLEGLNITFDGTKVNITLALGYAPDNFNITFYGYVRQEEVTSVSSSSSSSVSFGCLINWSCSNWSQCFNNQTIRTCNKVAPLYCYGGKKPIENKTCNMIKIIDVVCTRDVKICPDGSSVGRIAPNCEFASCQDAAIEKDKGLSLKWKIVIGIIIGGLIGYIIYLFFFRPSPPFI